MKDLLMQVPLSVKALNMSQCRFENEQSLRFHRSVMLEFLNLSRSNITDSHVDSLFSELLEYKCSMQTSLRSLDVSFTSVTTSSFE